jgi:adenylate kinase
MSEETDKIPVAPAREAGLENTGLPNVLEDARLIFNEVWQELETDLGREFLRFAREIILLGGAPGAGKGTNTKFILEARGLTCPPIVVSDLLSTPEARTWRARRRS